MSHDRVTEFVTVLVFALSLGALLMLAIMYLEGTWRDLGIIGVTALTVVCWQVLRRKFSRGR